MRVSSPAGRPSLSHRLLADSPYEQQPKKKKYKCFWLLQVLRGESQNQGLSGVKKLYCGARLLQIMPIPTRYSPQFSITRPGLYFETLVCGLLASTAGWCILLFFSIHMPARPILYMGMFSYD